MLLYNDNGSRQSSIKNLVGDNYISPLLTFARNSNATFMSASGSLVEVTNNTPRFASQGLLFGGARTNFCTNPRMSGAVVGIVGSGGSLPTGYTVSGTGLTTTVISTTAVDNYNRLRLRFAASSAPSIIIFNFPGTYTSNSGDILQPSIYAQVVDGTLTNVNTSSLASFGTASTVPQISTSVARLTGIRTSNGSAVGASLRFACTAGAAVDFTIDCWLPQMEIGAVPSTVILPPVGSTTTSSRVADSLSSSLTNLGIASSGFTLIGRAVIPQSAPTGVDQLIWQVDDNTNTNRYALLNVAAGNSIQTRIGSTTGSALFTMTPNTSFGYAASVNIAAGTISVSINGSNAVTQSSGPTSGLTTLRFGSNALLASNLFGSLQSQRLILTPMPVSSLPSLSLSV